MRNFAFVAAGAAAAVVLSSAALAGAQSTTIYEQAPYIPEFPGSGTYSHTTANDRHNQRIADNFTAPGDATVNQIKFWGVGENLFDTELDNFPSISVQILSSVDNGAGGTEPGTLLFDQTFLMDDLNPTSVYSPALQGGPVWEFTANIADFDLTAGTEYWFTPAVNQINPDGDNWVWQYSRVVDDITGVDRLLGAGWFSTSVLQSDFSFSMRNVVPEPASFGLLLPGMLLLKRRR